MTQGEAMLTAVFSKAMKGDIACAKFLYDCAAKTRRLFSRCAEKSI